MCAESLGSDLASAGYTLGLLYITPAFAADLSSILTFLSEKTRIPHWVGGVGYGVFAGEHEYHQGGAIVAMALDLPTTSFAVTDTELDLPFDDPAFALVHTLDAKTALDGTLRQATKDGLCFLVGGMLNPNAAPDKDHYSMVAEKTVNLPLSGVFYTRDYPLISGLTQGCMPLGQTTTVTEAKDSIVIRLDDRPALDVLKEQAGDLIARRLEQASGYIHVAQPMAGDDRAGYCVCPLTGIDRKRGWLATALPLSPGSPLLFVKRDPNSAQSDMRRMLLDLKKRAGSRRIRGGIYISCVGRGPRMFGPGSREMRMIRGEFPEIPLIGFAAGGQIFRDSMHAYAGTLTLFLEEEA